MKMMVDEQDDKPWHIGFPHMKKFSPWKTVSHMKLTWLCPSMAISLTDTKWSPYNTQCNQLIMISTFQQLSSQSVSHFEKIVNERMKKKQTKI